MFDLFVSSLIYLLLIYFLLIYLSVESCLSTKAPAPEAKTTNLRPVLNSREYPFNLLGRGAIKYWVFEDTRKSNVGKTTKNSASGRANFCHSLSPKIIKIGHKPIEKIEIL